MKRKAYSKLIEWKKNPEHKPLMVYGARQVGKTWLIREFGEHEFDDFIYINCYKNAVVESLFDGDVDTNRLLTGLSAYAGKNIVARRSLLFFDEIQEIPSIVSSLKYFCENCRNLHIVAAGSLLGVMNMKGESFPVGKVDMMHLYPMSFDEFLEAMGQPRIVRILDSQDWQMIDTFSDKLKDYLRKYYYTGGMPEAVKCFAESGDLLRVREIQEAILSAYEADIAKHTGGETQRVRMVWQSVPQQLARENKKFLYGSVRQGARAKDFEIAIQWLVDAGLVYKVERAREARLPLRYYADTNAFKLYLLDVGLLGAMAEVSASQIIISDNVFTEYKGSFTENYVLQQLRTASRSPIYYYSKDNSTLEIDFLTQAADRIIPIEVKAETNVRSRSLRSFVDNVCKGEPVKALRFSMLAYHDQGWMENVPLYAVESYIQTK